MAGYDLVFIAEVDLPLAGLLSPSVERALNQTGTAAVAGIAVTLGVNLATSFVKGESVEAMWLLVSAMQILSLMPLLALSFPPNLLRLFGLLDFSHGGNEHI